MKRRVVVTGMGALTPSGLTVDESFDAVVRGVSKISKITSFDASTFTTTFAGEIKDFNPEDYFDRKESARKDRFVQLAVVAARQAVKQANIDFSKINKDRAGVIIGSGIGGISTIIEQHLRFLEKGARRISPFLIPMLIINMASGEVAIEFGLRGINKSQATACATGAHAIGDALRHIQVGEADLIIAGGSEAAITTLGFGGFCSIKALSKRNDDPKTASRPFDKNRDGFVMSEGAAVVVLEEMEHALSRGAKILGEVTGYGATCDAYHMTAPDPSGIGAINSMKLALNEAGIKPQQVDYINCHGTSTLYNDKIETFAIKQVFGDYAKDLHLSSTKSTVGHMLGAAGSVEVIFCLKAMETSVIPPTINYEEKDEDCDLNYCPNIAVKKEVNIAISNSLGFGGHNCTIAVKKFEK